MMKKGLALLCALLLCALPVLAAEGNVTYQGDAGKFIFTPGSDHSPTDLFPNFKDVMPGDSITQPITVKNDASNGVKVKIYLRALGAQPDSEDFLGRLRLRVEKSGENDYLFDAAASESAQLTDRVCLGTLYSGGEVTLNVILDVPASLENQYQQQVGYLDWEFLVEEFEIEPDDPEPPKTGDDGQMFLWLGVMLASLCGLLLLWRRRKTREP